MVQGQIYITWSKQTCLPATNVKDRPQPRCRYCLRHRLEIHRWHPPHQWRGYMPSSSCSAAMHTQRHPTKTVVVGLVGVVVVLLLAAVAVAVAQDIHNITKLELVDQLAPSSMDHRSTVLLAMGGREHLSLQYNMYLLNKNVLCIYTYYIFIIYLSFRVFTAIWVVLCELLPTTCAWGAQVALRGFCQRLVEGWNLPT